MRFLINILRVLVGSLFVVSGLIKANDTIGFSYKLIEYFQVFNIDWMIPLALTCAIWICIFEILLGIMLLMGSKINITIWSLLIMILFFTFLTFYSAYFNKVTDCGCFGDAIKLSPWESFYKDIVLLLSILFLFLKKDIIKPLFLKKQRVIHFLVIILSFFFIYYSYNHLPIKDFRPYAVGKNIKEGMKSCYELGLPCHEQASIYIVKDKETGELNKMNSNDWMLQFNKYEFVEATNHIEVIKKGYQSPITDFSIELNSMDITDSILNAKIAYLVISYDITKADKESSKYLGELYQNCIENTIPFVALSASSISLKEDFRNSNNIIFNYGFSDETTLKTIIRSNPGVVVIKDGTVIEKWHYNDFDDYLMSLESLKN